jgi:pyrroloquinoline quinone biosynthesis protein B
MRVLVLGSAAGGGFPQWNSNAGACRLARAGDSRVLARAQASVAVSADGFQWFLLNASPDLRQQIEANAVLHPVRGLRSSPIAGVVLTGGDVDAIAGLLTLRERQSFTILATAHVHAMLKSNAIFDVLARDVVQRRVVALDVEVSLDLPDGSPSGLCLELFAVPGKAPLYLEEAASATADASPAIEQGEQTVGAVLSHGGTRMFFIPSCAAMPPGLAERLRGADLILFDGTLWQDDEMIRAGIGTKTGRRMGHISVSGPGGAMAAFRDIDVAQKVLIHINNSNPILLDDSPERAVVEAAGWRVAFDGMELAL